jgi:hypothetical protein
MIFGMIDVEAIRAEHVNFPTLLGQRRITDGSDDT